MSIENLKAVIHNNGHDKMVSVELFTLVNTQTSLIREQINFHFNRDYIHIPMKYITGPGVFNSTELDYLVASYFYMAYRDSLKEIISYCFFTNGNGMSTFSGFFDQTYIPGPTANIIKKDLETYGKL